MKKNLPPLPKIVSRDAQAFTASYTESTTFRLPAIDQLAINPSVPVYMQFGVEIGTTGQIDWEQSEEVSFPAGTWTNYGTHGELAGFNVCRLRGQTLSGTADLKLNYSGR